VLVAFFLAQQWLTSGNNHFHTDGITNWWSLGSALISASLLYVGGCFLGDFRDLAFDRKHRPTRPLPQGVLKPSTVHITAWVFIATALILTALHPHSFPFAGALAIAIISYAILHKKNRILALILMGSCRALLILYALAVASFPLGHLSLTLALTVGVYTVFLSSVAATESNPQQISFRKPLFVGMIALPLFAHCIIAKTNPLIFGGIFLIYLAWVTGAFKILPQSKPAFVSRALAGFCLLDACLATAYSLPLALICLVLFIAALGLQKLAPAT